MSEQIDALVFPNDFRYDVTKAMLVRLELHNGDLSRASLSSEAKLLGVGEWFFFDGIRRAYVKVEYNGFAEQVAELTRFSPYNYLNIADWSFEQCQCAVYKLRHNLDDNKLEAIIDRYSSIAWQIGCAMDQIRGNTNNLRATGSSNKQSYEYKLRKAVGYSYP